MYSLMYCSCIMAPLVLLLLFIAKHIMKDILVE